MDPEASSSLFETVLRKFRSKESVVGVVGLGYVGLPLCLAFAKAGTTVIGFDTDVEKTSNINEGRSYLRIIPDGEVKQATESLRLTATSDLSRLSETDALLICVPTPLTSQLQPDLDLVREATRAITRTLRKGQLIVLESTTFPGTTSEILRTILENDGLRCGHDFWLGCSPEREDPGNPNWETATIPKVVGADDIQSRALVSALYNIFAKAVVEVSSSRTAEAVKLTENIFRAVNIGLMNELKVVYEAMDIDIWEVIEAAKSKPFGFMPFYPGPGVGGHCIPVDPYYLSWKAREFNLRTRFIELAGEINESMPEHVVNKLATHLDMRTGKGLSVSRILVIGVAYKKNIDDVRESPSLRILSLLQSHSAAIAYYDPYIPSVSIGGVELESEPWDLELLKKYDAMIVATDHDEIDFDLLASTECLIIDTRNACSRARAKGNVVAA